MILKHFIHTYILVLLMPVTYQCNSCNYFTTRKSSYDDHLTSQKHFNNVANAPNTVDNENLNSDDEEYEDDEHPIKNTNNLTCEHCQRTVSCVWSLKRHFTRCDAKKISDLQHQFDKKEQEFKQREIQFQKREAKLKRTILKQKKKLDDVNNKYLVQKELLVNEHKNMIDVINNKHIIEKELILKEQQLLFKNKELHLNNTISDQKKKITKLNQINTDYAKTFKKITTDE